VPPLSDLKLLSTSATSTTSTMDSLVCSQTALCSACAVSVLIPSGLGCWYIGMCGGAICERYYAGVSGSNSSATSESLIRPRGFGDPFAGKTTRTKCRLRCTHKLGAQPKDAATLRQELRGSTCGSCQLRCVRVRRAGILCLLVRAAYGQQTARPEGHTSHQSRLVEMGAACNQRSCAPVSPGTQERRMPTNSSIKRMLDAGHGEV
jgi:hypothetical protein